MPGPLRSIQITATEWKPVAAKRKSSDAPAAASAPSANENKSAKRAAVSVTLSGGKAQPPRVIGYKRTGANVDITVRVEQRSFPAHTNVLAAASGFFERHGAQLTPRDNHRPVELPAGHPAPAFAALLEFFYLGECNFPEALLVPVLELAAYLQADAALASARAAVTKRLAPSNCLEYLGLASRLALPQLKTAAEAMVRTNFDAVRTHSTFGMLPEDFFCTLLADDNLGITKEEAAFEAAVAWLSAQEKQQQQQKQPSTNKHASAVKKPLPSAEARRASAIRVLKLVRYPTMPRSHVTEYVLSHPLIVQHDGMRLVLDSFLESRYGPPTARCTPRNHVPPISYAATASPGLPGSGKALRRRSRSRSRGRSSGEEGLVTVGITVERV